MTEHGIRNDRGFGKGARGRCLQLRLMRNPTTHMETQSQPESVPGHRCIMSHGMPEAWGM